MFEGKAINEDEITLEHVQKVASLLAKLHNINFEEVKFNCFINTYEENGGDIKDLNKAIYSNFKKQILVLRFLHI